VRSRKAPQRLCLRQVGAEPVQTGDIPDTAVDRAYRKEPLGWFPIDDRFYTIYFAAVPVAQFDAHTFVVAPVPKEKSVSRRGAREGDVSPSRAPHLLGEPEKKVSGMCPV
jgi:hypothetical protein